ncbi:MAG: hypothetical protein A3C53_08350 [Omnitrophica WOR_2 bacterium RIFCSPHIGHO2_02_FULL_68_15]|nr:MAG: hypothetical protein A3C53_08350 [Omnitrophica WOR_2 bacterium RIFCSPHIGHO2_02_FULL_68_15]
MPHDLARSHRLFRAFADPTRLRILTLLRGGERCVCHLFDVLRLPQSTVSRHLAYLRRAGLIISRAQGTWHYYRLAPPSGPVHRILLGCLAVGAGPANRRCAGRRASRRRRMKPTTP